MNLIVTSLDRQINNMLVLGRTGSGASDTTSSDNPNSIFTDSNGNCGAQDNACNNYYAAWRSFRNIALGLLVIAGLIMVISQALGMEILDAYTIRKMLPRILIATIAITLSWQLMRFFVTVSNDLGYGVGHLLDAPFHSLGQNIKVGGGKGILATFALALGGIFFDLFGMLAFVGTAAIAVIVTFLVLILRQIAVILLVIVSPIAILAYVLPNTQRAYKFWWESFSKLLLMFPMIVAFITAGHIFSAISSDQGSGFIHQAIAFIAYFGPYFAVPLTFRFSGAMMGGLSNAVNSNGLTNGARGLLSNVRSNRAKYNAGRLKAGTRFEGRIPGTRRIQDGINEATKGIGTGFKGRFGLGAVGKEARAKVTQGAGAELMKDPGMRSIRGKNDYNRVLAEGMGDQNRGRQALIDHLTTGGDDGKTFLSEAQAAERADTAVAAAKSAGAFTKAHGVAAFYNMAQDGTAIRDVNDLGRLAARVGEGDGVNTYTYAAEAAGISKGAGRHDLSASTESIGDLALQQGDELYNGGRPKLYNPAAQGKEHLSQDRLTDDAKMSAFGNSQQYEWLTQGKGRALRNGNGFLAEVMSDKTGRFTAEQKQEAAEHMASSLSSIKSGLGADNKRAEAYKALQPALEDYEQYMEGETGEVHTEQAPVRQYVKDDTGQVITEQVSQRQVERPQTNRDVAAKSGNTEHQRGLSTEQMQEGMGGGGAPEEEEQ